MLSWRSLFFLPLLLLEGACSENTITPIKDPNTDGDPGIEVEPRSLDWGIIPAGESEVRVATVRSVGSVTLNIGAMQINEGRWAFSLTDPIIGLLEPGEERDVVITYNSAGTAAEGELQVLSNDPDNSSLAVLLTSGEETPIDSGDSGETGTPLSQPVAVCSAAPPSVEAIHESTTWVGDTSYDPDGTIVSYSWTLVSSPAGATATMPPGTANRRNFTPDVAGDYVAELVVTDDDGIISEPCTATLTATAGEGLWIEMFWENSGDDMDLHLVNGSGALMSNQDCYYANCTWASLDWGARGNPDDDPILDLDDIPGVGPENINIAVPSRGTYTVYVHDYPGSAYIGRNNVTVNVYEGGFLAWTDTRNINSENCYEPFVEISIPGGATTDLAGSCR